MEVTQEEHLGNTGSEDLSDFTILNSTVLDVSSRSTPLDIHLAIWIDSERLAFQHIRLLHTYQENAGDCSEDKPSSMQFYMTCI